MSIISQYSRVSHHTVTYTGITGTTTFTVPSSEDFTDGSWDVYDLCRSEIGVDEDRKRAFIRIGNEVKSFNFDTSVFGVGSGLYSIKAINTSGIDASGSYSYANGFNTQASSNYSYAGGIKSVAKRTGEWVRSGAVTSSNVLIGQYGNLDFWKKTANATPIELKIDSDVSNDVFLVEAGELIRFKITVLTKDTTTGAGKEWIGEGLIKNVGGTTSMVGTNTTVSTFADVSLATASLAVTADNTNDKLLIMATGINDTQLTWYAKLEYTKII